MRALAGLRGGRRRPRARGESWHHLAAMTRLTVVLVVALWTIGCKKEGPAGADNDVVAALNAALPTIATTAPAQQQQPQGR